MRLRWHVSKAFEYYKIHIFHVHVDKEIDLQISYENMQRASRE